jgi:superfamily II DNA or RNA helicase
LSIEKKIRDLELRLSELERERTQVIATINELKAEYRAQAASSQPLLGSPVMEGAPTSSQEKVELFLKLFRAREDVYPKRWENAKTGKQGYSPVCMNEWVKPICQKPQVRCADCAHQKFSPLDERAVEMHLRGAATIGTYAIRDDDTCVFLACDFDETSWQADAAAYRDTGRTLGIEIAIERSRSGNGAHAWVFFDAPIPARLARSLGTLLLAQCSEQNPRLSLESYDRFFPAQDFLPKGGFGNLIALPLQKQPRETGNSCFLDEEFRPIEDQWRYLARVRRLSRRELDSILVQYFPRTIDRRGEAFDDRSWAIDNSILEKTSSSSSESSKSEGALAGKDIEVICGPMLSVPLENLPGKVIARLKKTASFANPEFYKLQRMRMQTYPHPRFIFSGELRPDQISLPRGVLDEVTKILTSAGGKVIVRDERIGRKKIDVAFSGELTEAQSNAVKAIKKSDFGILLAPPGAGKTVMGCALIAERKVSTLILVHRQPLLEQWQERIITFLGVPKKEIGRLSGAKKKMTGRIDLAMLQSLTRLEDASEIAQVYSQVIIDECHHIPAASFEAILKQLPARFIIGLTATPYRKDGLEKILFQQCGPIRHEMAAVDSGTLEKVVEIHETGLRIPAEWGPQPPYHMLMEHLVTDSARNELIADLTVRALQSGRFPLVISDRKEHLDLLAKGIQAKFQEFELVQLDGDLSPKQRRDAISQVHEQKGVGKSVLLMSTASLVGEGFDLPALDTLVVATPLSFEGRMIQYAGRLHRLVEGKSNVRIIDFVDSFSAMFLKMYRNRLQAYRKMGYQIEEPSRLMGGLFAMRRG